MTTTERARIPRLRFGALLWSAGILGAVAVTVGVLPQLTGQVPLPGPLWLIAILAAALALATQR